MHAEAAASALKKRVHDQRLIDYW